MNRKTISSLCLWGSRISAALLLLFWGAFFIEHLTEWFSPSAIQPPLKVWLSMFFHLVMLAGLGIMVKWQRIGTCTMAFGTVAFYLGIGFHGFPYILLLNIIPAGFLGVYRQIKRNENSKSK